MTDWLTYWLFLFFVTLCVNTKRKQILHVGSIGFGTLSNHVWWGPDFVTSSNDSTCKNKRVKSCFCPSKRKNVTYMHHKKCLLKKLKLLLNNVWMMVNAIFIHLLPSLGVQHTKTFLGWKRSRGKSVNTHIRGSQNCVGRTFFSPFHHFPNTFCCNAAFFSSFI